MLAGSILGARRGGAVASAVPAAGRGGIAAAGGRTRRPRRVFAGPSAGFIVGMAAGRRSSSARATERLWPRLDFSTSLRHQYRGRHRRDLCASASRCWRSSPDCRCYRRAPAPLVFVPGDLLKAALAASLANFVKRGYPGDRARRPPGRARHDRARLFTALRGRGEPAGDAAALVAGGTSVTYARTAGRSPVLRAAARARCRTVERKVPSRSWPKAVRFLLMAFSPPPHWRSPAMPLDPAGRQRRLRACSPGIRRPPSRRRSGPPICSPQPSVGEPSTEATPTRRRAAPSLSVEAEAEFYWGLTSGTTGESKTLRPHAMPPGPPVSRPRKPSSLSRRNRSVLIPGPLHHSLFLYGAVHALCRGLTVILTGRIPAQPDRAVPCAVRRTSTPCHSCWANWPRRASRRRSSGASSPAAPKCLPRSDRHCERRWPAADLIEFYGASETSFLTLPLDAAPGERRLRRPSVSGRGHRRSATMTALRCRPAAMARSSREPDAVLALCRRRRRVEGWFSVGDMGVLDAAGCLHLTGRSNRIINSKALKIHPETIEAALDGAAGGPRARRWSTCPTHARRGRGRRHRGDRRRSFARGSLSAHCRQTLGARYCPRRYYIADRLPLTASGKLAVGEIRARAAGERPRIPGIAMSRRRAIVIAARRTAIGKLGGLHRHRPIEMLAAPLIPAVLADAGLDAGVDRRGHHRQCRRRRRQSGTADRARRRAAR